MKAWAHFRWGVWFFTLCTFLVMLSNFGYMRRYAFGIFPSLPAFHWFTNNGGVESLIPLFVLLLFLGMYRGRWVLLLAIAVYSWICLNNYSAFGAFTHFVAIEFLFLVLFWRPRSPLQASCAARWTLGLMFLIGAFHKVNPLFLSGFELRAGTFFWATRISARPYVAALGTLWYAGLIIAFEALVGVLCLLNIPLGGLLILLFPLGLCLCQVQVSTVYFAFWPFVALAFPIFHVGQKRFLKRQKFAPLIMLLIFGSSLMVVWTGQYIGLITLSVCAALAYAHSLTFLNPFLLRGVFRQTRRLFRKRSKRCLGLRPAVWCGACLIYGLLPLFYRIPEPFSYTMFSSRNMSADHWQKRISNPKICAALYDEFYLRWVGYLMWDVHESQSPCSVHLFSSEIVDRFFYRVCHDQNHRSLADAICKDL